MSLTGKSIKIENNQKSQITGRRDTVLASRWCMYPGHTRTSCSRKPDAKQHSGPGQTNRRTDTRV